MIRAFRPEDADAVTALLHEDDVPTPVTGPGILHWHEGQPQRARLGSWVAVEDGEVVAWVRARLRWATSAEGVGEAWVFVGPTQRDRGLGSGLYERASAHLEAVGARVVESWSETEQGAAFLGARGFRAVRLLHVLRLDLPADVAPLAGLRAVQESEGFAVVPLSGVLDRPRELHAVDAAAAADVPMTHAEDDFRYEDWIRETLGHPQLSPEGSAVVLAGEQPVAYALLHVDPDARLAANEMTGTHRDFRRRGLARLAKLATIAWAQERGFESIVTASDSENVGMVHLNQSLGYRAVATETQYLRDEPARLS